MKTWRRHLVIGAVAAVSAVGMLGAQAPGEPEHAFKTQTLVYELALRRAVDVGGQKLAQQALVLVPDVMLATNEQPIVRGVRLRDYGYIFDVQAPDIHSTMIVWDMVQQNRPSLRQQVSGGNGVAATGGTVAADPMVASPAPFDPTKAYTAYVHDALLDALLDSSGVLPLGSDERLTITASGIDQPNPNPLYRSGSSRKLILTIKGSDLQEYREGRITREQVRARVSEDRF